VLVMVAAGIGAETARGCGGSAGAGMVVVEAGVDCVGCCAALRRNQDIGTSCEIRRHWRRLTDQARRNDVHDTNTQNLMRRNVNKLGWHQLLPNSIPYWRSILIPFVINMLASVKTPQRIIQFNEMLQSLLAHRLWR
jgi:hypothetical protein